MFCGVCRGVSEVFGKSKILEKYLVTYSRCTSCGFVSTEAPYWLEEAYSEAMQFTDVGIMQRNLQNSIVTSSVISSFFSSGKKFIDFGGGHGAFVRLMRDRGYDFYWQDLHAKNLYARGFEHIENTRYELLTAFEVMEHLSSPIQDLAPVFSTSDNLLFTTTLLPDPAPQPPEWWYYSTKGGQHISFYTPAALDHIARYFGRYVVSNRDYHLFSKRPICALRFRLATEPRLSRFISLFSRKKSLIESDYEYLSGGQLR
jgi:hypothetical protein